jgi:hypothetical protein
MISVVIYGRNDNYGYNLHKRAGLSLNCIANILCDPDDEIIFVDYNTPDDFPTFPEAIRDTLTPEACRRLRILRVRPEIHQRYQPRTHLPVIEAVARNVAVRRANPRNRWILSTNTDMIFVDRKETSLSTIAQDLPRGYYHLPRFDIPESIWEKFDRRDPAGTIVDAKYWGRALHLNEIVRSHPFFLYDAPGDFQLVERDDMFRIHGFHEDMLLGWHIDSNLSKRLYLLHGKVGDLSDRLIGYHCNHMRQATPKHSDTKADDWGAFIDDVRLPELPSQAQTWGCPEDTIEELSLSSCPSDVYRAILQQTIGARMTAPSTILYRGEFFDRIKYDARHVLPYLSDIFVNCPRSWNVAWIGSRSDMLRLFGAMWTFLGFNGRIMVDAARKETQSSIVTRTSFASILQEADAFVFDFGEITGDGEIYLQQPWYRQRAADLMEMFWAVIDVEQSRAQPHKRSKRRIIAINSMNGYLESLVSENVSGAKTRISTRIRHGFAVDSSNIREEWLPRMLAGPSGILVDGGIRARLGFPGHVVYGPYRALRPGCYEVTATIQAETTTQMANARAAPLVLEVVNRDNFLGRMDLSLRDLSLHTLKFEVDCCGWAIEVRLWSTGSTNALITSVAVEKVRSNIEALV